MHGSRYQTAAEFLKRVGPALEKDEVVNNLMLGLSLRLVDDPKYYGSTPYFVTIDADDGAFSLAGVRTPPYNLILYSTTKEHLPAVETLVHHLQAEGQPIPGVLAPSQLADDFARLWSQQTGAAGRLAARERVYELRQVNPMPMPPGFMHAARESELELLTRWTQAFNQDISSRDTSEQAAAEAARKRLPGSYLWEIEDEHVVSLACVGRTTPHGAVVGPVYTPPEFRGHGYASACVANLSQLMLDSGYQFCALYTDLANPTSNHIYQVIGYQPRSDFHEYRFDLSSGIDSNEKDQARI